MVKTVVDETGDDSCVFWLLYKFVLSLNHRKSLKPFPVIFVGSSCMFPWEHTYLPVQTLLFYLCPQLCSLDVFISSMGHIPEKGMEPHSSTLAWKIPWMEELQSMGLLRVGHDSVTSLSLFTFMHWRRKWQPTPVFLPGESQGRRSLVGCCLWGRTESDTTEAT